MKHILITQYVLLVLSLSCMHQDACRQPCEEERVLLDSKCARDYQTDPDLYAHCMSINKSRYKACSDFCDQIDYKWADPLENAVMHGRYDDVKLLMGQDDKSISNVDKCCLVSHSLSGKYSRNNCSLWLLCQKNREYGKIAELLMKAGYHHGECVSCPKPAAYFDSDMFKYNRYMALAIFLVTNIAGSPYFMYFSLPRSSGRIGQVVADTVMNFTAVIFLLTSYGVLFIGGSRQLAKEEKKEAAERRAIHRLLVKYLFISYLINLAFSLIA